MIKALSKSNILRNKQLQTLRIIAFFQQYFRLYIWNFVSSSVYIKTMLRMRLMIEIRRADKIVFGQHKTETVP